MESTSQTVDSTAIAAKKKLSSDFLRKGIIVALFSGLSYGFYTAFLALGMAKGPWEDWYKPENTAGLSAFVITYLLAAMGSAINDGVSALWALGISGVRGRLGDFFRCLKTTPGKVMIFAAIIGGPLSSTAYIVGLQMAGSIVVPISALCPAIGAILSRFMFKQKLTPRILLGIGICFFASFLIGNTTLDVGVSPKMLIGVLFGFAAAIGWGFEGCVCGYGTSMIEPEIGITIRQTASALSNFILLLPLFSIIAGSDVSTVTLLTQALTSWDSMIWFIVSGLCAYSAFMFWYEGNGMCGTALGMSCNGTFSFWGPLCCWLVLGIMFGIPEWTIPPIAWFAAVLMVVGIFIIALNPLDLFKKKNA